MHLRILNLGGWASLEYLPDWIEELKELTTLRLYNCTRLTVLACQLHLAECLRYEMWDSLRFYTIES